MRCDAIWWNARLATLAAGASGLGEIGRRSGRPTRWPDRLRRAADRRPRPDAERDIDCDGRWITPGLIDCHTHLVFAGDRSARVRTAASPGRPTRRSPGPAAASSRRCARPAPPARPTSSPRPPPARRPARRGRDHGGDQVGVRPGPRSRDAASSGPRARWPSPPRSTCGRPTSGRPRPAAGIRRRPGRLSRPGVPAR